MLLSHSHKFIFVHVFKTGGTSLRKVLAPHARFADRLAYHYAPTVALYGLVERVMGWQREGMRPFTGFHRHAKAYRIQERVGQKVFNDYLTCAFVRNPFDWLASLYTYIKETPSHYQHAVANTHTLYQFIEFQLANDLSRQCEYVLDGNGNNLVDFIGHFESLEEDVTRLCKELDIPFHGLPHLNKTGSRPEDYRTLYDKETISLVEEHFARDLELFGYQFE